jgi:Rho-binding antiterminator
MAAHMTNQPRPYIPINCEFHDVLESLATTGASATIVFRNESGTIERRSAAIADVYARDGEEFLVLDTGERLRLDRLLEVDGEKLVDD